MMQATQREKVVARRFTIRDSKIFPPAGHKHDASFVKIGGETDMGKGLKLLAIIVAFLLGSMSTAFSFAVDAHAAMKSPGQSEISHAASPTSQDCHGSPSSSSQPNSSEHPDSSSHSQSCLIHCHLNQALLTSQTVEMPLLSETRQMIETKSLLGRTIEPGLRPPKRS